MKFKHLLLLALICVCFSSLSAQKKLIKESLHQHDEHCIHSKIQEEYRIQNPKEFKRWELIKSQVEQVVQNRETPSPTELEIIPIYMHIFHNGGSSTTTGDNNFTTAEIQSAIDRLNEVYAGRRPNLDNVNDDFINSGVVATHTNIQFCWVPTNINRVDYSVAPTNNQLINPDPNCFGRIREGNVVLASGTSLKVDNFVSPYVNPCTFLNIYTGPYGVNHPSIAADTTCANRNGLGYAFKIYQSDGGVRIDDNMFVPGGAITIPTKGFDLGMTLAHEVGHYLCLSHVWGPTNITSVISDSLSSNPEYLCNIDDGFGDTPNVGRPSWGITSPYKNLSVTQCGSPIMWTNIMDYHDDYNWRINFTDDQVAYMHLLLETARAYKCGSMPSSYNGELSCTLDETDCEPFPPSYESDTIVVCQKDTLNLLDYLNTWGFNSTSSPNTYYQWYLITPTEGIEVDYPAHTPVVYQDTSCLPSIYKFELRGNCIKDGSLFTVAGLGEVIVKVYGNPYQEIFYWLQNGDCDDGPTTIIKNSTLCSQYINIDTINWPTLPTIASGTVQYSITFDAEILGPCLDPSTVIISDSASYNCIGTASNCNTAMVIVSPNFGPYCEGTDFEANITADYEANYPVSVFDPDDNLTNYYYFSDPSLSTVFDPDVDIVHPENTCDIGSTLTFYPAIGCDLDNNGEDDFIIPIGNIKLVPTPIQYAPTLDLSTNMDQDCIYTIIPSCGTESVTPSPIPLEICGATDLPDITFNVLTTYGCSKDFVLEKPDCPECYDPAFCVSVAPSAPTTETICHGDVATLPELVINDAAGTYIETFWSIGPIDPFDPFANTLHSHTSEGISYTSPIEHPDPYFPVTLPVILFAYALCDDDGDPDSPPIYGEVGTHEVLVMPPPLVEILPICGDVPAGDSLSFYVEINLFDIVPSSIYTITNSYDASSVTTSIPGMTYIGPFPNDVSVSVTISADYGCSVVSDYLTANCRPSMCDAMDFDFTSICLDESSTDHYVEIKISGASNSPQYIVSVVGEPGVSVLNQIQHPIDTIGPLPPNPEIIITDFVNPICSTSSGIIDNSVYVDASATGTNDGSSWADAYTDLQDALAVAGISCGKDIFIAASTYKPGVTRGKFFTIENTVNLYGGYPIGGGTTADPVANPTILSGDIDTDGTLVGNSFHVVKVSGGATVNIYDLTITGGNADGDILTQFGRSRGGGIYINDAICGIYNCNITNNFAGLGGGVFATLSSSTIIDGCKINLNVAGRGSALYHSNETNMYVRKSRILNNNSTNRCAIEINNSLYTSIEQSVIANNASANANAIGLIATNRNQTCDIINSTILGQNNNKSLLTMQIGFGDELNVNLSNSIVAHQNYSFTKNIVVFNNNILNLNVNNSYFAGSALTNLQGGGTNNISQTAVLYSTVAGDLNLNPNYSTNVCSPVVNTGDNISAGLLSSTTDINDSPRIAQGTVDMGAYEKQGLCAAREAGATFSTTLKNDIIIYPNSVDNILNIQTEMEKISVSISDVLGRIVVHSFNDRSINIGQLPRGMYIINIYQNGELKGSEKIIKN